MPAVIEEFTTRVDHFMSLADFFIGKAGPGSISEASAIRPPGNRGTQFAHLAARTLQRNLDDGKDLGIVVPDFDKSGL